MAAMHDRDPLLIVGSTIADKYVIERMVGEGGFAVVYRALHTIWKKPVAIKFFSGLSAAPVYQREALTESFIQEGALLTELSTQSANIVQARDVGTYTSPDGQWMPYMVLEWLDGKGLDEVLEAERARGLQPWSLPQVLQLLAPVAHALDIVHRKGIAHRDIKPANLFVLGGDPRTDTCTVKLLDFGVAKLMADNTQMQAALAKTGQNITSFTPQYGAPEQFSRSYGATGPWTDVFALALIAVEMLAGRCGLDGNDVVQLAFSAGNPDRRPTPRTLGVFVPDAVEAVFRTALALRPQDRFASAAEFWRALGAAISGTPFDTLVGTGRQMLDTGATVLAGTGITPISAPQPLSGPQGSVPPQVTGVPLTATAAPASRSGSRAAFAIGGAVLLAAAAGGGFLVLRGSSQGPANPVSAAAATIPAATPSAAPPPAPTCPERMVKIEAGQFFQGSDQKDALANEKPSHNVKLDAYCMDLYEVTAREYRACSEVGKCRRAPTDVEWPKIKERERKTYGALCTGADQSKGDYPINCVTWDMANTFCNAQGKRLPHEAEWEYATRGPDGRVYPWGDDEPTAAHLNACGPECVKWGKTNGEALDPLYTEDDGWPTLAPVGKFPKGRSRFGPYDVAGNVWEWVADWYGDYDPTDKKNPAGPSSGERRVIRGGAWNGSYATWLRPSFRFAQVPDARSHGIGFRCAKSLTP
jgi:formylglycine-generating enzyme required for sulfatase activity/serine/threonine protein kinase